MATIRKRDLRPCEPVRVPAAVPELMVMADAAAVVGLANAWDAMTTERPYHRALDLDEAFAEVRDGRGTQFAPEVVDAFFSVVRKRPGELGTRDGEAGAQARAAG